MEHIFRSSITRRQVLLNVSRLGAGALAAPWLARLAAAAEGGRRPNILFIMSDDHASHALSCYGSRINRTLHLDRLAAQGARFENAFCTNSICGPSRATVLTGKYSHIHGVRRNGDRFDGSQPTFIKLLRDAGYQTAVIGKWHLTSDPTGFDHWNILPGQGRYYDPELILMGRRSVHKGYVTDVLTDLSIEYLSQRDPNRPFCLMCHHNASHRPWEPSPRYAQMYEDQDIPLPPTFNDDWSGRTAPAREQEMTIERHLTRTDLKQDPPAGLSGQRLKEWKYQRFIKDYLRCVAALDDNVGRLMDWLDESKLADNTIVVYTSDNGFFLGDHGWFDKRFMYEQALRVPLLIRWPGVTPAGAVIRELVINADYAPTFLDAAGIAVPGDIQGRSLRGVLAGRAPQDWRKSMYYRYYEFPQPHHAPPHYGVRTDRYKLFHYHTIDQWEMFDLEKDPHELRSVYDDPAYADVRQELKKELARLQRELRDTPA